MVKKHSPKGKKARIGDALFTLRKRGKSPWFFAVFLIVLFLIGQLTSKAYAANFYPNLCFGTADSKKAVGQIKNSASDQTPSEFAVTIDEENVTLDCAQFRDEGKSSRVRKVQEATLKIFWSTNTDSIGEGAKASFWQTKKALAADEETTTEIVSEKITEEIIAPEQIENVISGQTIGTTEPIEDTVSDQDAQINKATIAISYTLDNAIWQDLANVGINNLATEFPLNLKDSSDIANFHLRVTSIGDFGQNLVLLDGFAISAVFQNDFSDEEIEALPRVDIGEELFVAPKKDFRADEAVEFEIKGFQDAGTSQNPTASLSEARSISIANLKSPAHLVAQGVVGRQISNLQYIFPAHAEEITAGAVQVLTAEVYDPIGNTGTITPLVQEIGGTTKIIVNKPTRGFRPGRYRLHLEVLDLASSQILISDQNFTWGVLAINLNKSVYLPFESAYLQMGVLDDQGSTICNANLKLEITDPLGGFTILTTASGSISLSDQCDKNNVTDTPDYFAYYTTGDLGVYQMTLTNLTNLYSVTDTFEVRNYAPMTIERISATRINPFKANYRMIFELRANEAFSGAFSETLPDNFEVIDPTINNDTAYDLLITSGDKKIISWNLSLNRNQRKTITYTYDSPDVSPQLYLAGPASAGTIFTETRNWQIASDAACSSNGTGNWSNGATWSGCTGTGGVPAADDTITITDGHAVTLDTTATVAGLTLCDSACNADTSLTHSGSNALTVNGTVTINGGAGAGDNTLWTINGGSATVSGAISYNPQSTTGGRDAKIALSTGTLNANGGIVFENTAGSEDNQMLAMTSTATVNLKGSISNQTLADIQPGTTSTFVYIDSAAAQTVVFDATSSTYAKLTFSNTHASGVTLGAALTATNTTGDVNVLHGIFVTGGYNMTGTGSNTLTMSNGSQFDQTGATLISSFAGLSTSATSTYRLLTTNATFSMATLIYGNVVVSPQANNVAVTPSSGTLSMQGYLTLGGVGAYTGITLNIDTSDPTFNVDGDTTIGANHTLILSATGTATFGGSWTNAGTLTHSSGTVTFDATDTGNTINNNSSSFYNLKLNGSGGEWSALTNTLTIANDLTVSAGTLNNSAGTADITVNGNVACNGTCGTVNLTSGTFLQSVTTNKAFGTNVAVGTNWIFNNLTFTGTSDTITTSSTGTGTIEVKTNLTISTATTLDAGNRTFILSAASTTPATFTGTLTGNTSIFRYTGAGNTTIPASTGYSTVQLYPGANSAIFTLDSGTFTLSGDFIAGGNSSYTGTTVTLGANNPTMNITGDFTVCASSCPEMTFTKSSNTITLNGTANTKTITDNNTTKQDLGKIAIGNASAAKIVNMGSTLKLETLNITANATFSFNNGAYTLTITGTGTPLTKTGTFTATTGTTTYVGNGATTITAATYNNLQIFPGGASVTHTLASGTFTIGGDLDIGGNANGASTVVTAGANNPTIGLTGNLVVCASTCSNQMTFTKSSNTLTLNGTANTKTITDNNTTKQDLGALAIGNGATAKHIGLGSNIKATSVNITASAFFEPGAYTATLTANGTPFTVSGTFTPATSTIEYAPASTTGVTVASTTYHHVIFNKTSNTFSLTTSGITTDTANGGGDLTISAGTLDTVSGSNYPISIGGSWTNSDTFTANSGTVTFTSVNTGETLSGTLSGASSFNNIIFNGSGGEWTPGSAVNLNGDLTMTAGTLLGTQNITVAGGDVTGDGAITLTGGTFKVTGASGTGFGGATAWSFSSLTFGDGADSATTTATGSGGITVSSVLTIDATHTLDAAGKIWTLSGTTDPFVKTGTFTPNTSTFKFTGNGATNIPATTYYNLQVFPGGAVTHTLGAGTFTINNNLDLGGNTNPASTVITAATNSPTVNITGNLTLCATTCSNQMTFTKGGTITLSGAANTKSLTDNNTTKQDLGDITIGNASLAKIIQLGSSIKATSINITTNATLDANGTNTITLTGTTTPFTTNGAFTYSTSTVVFTGNASFTIPATTYYNLTFSPTVVTTGKTYTFGGAVAVNSALDINPDAATSLSLTVNLGGALTGSPAVTVRRQNSAASVLDTTAGNYGITATSFDIQAGGTVTLNASTVSASGAVTIASSGTLNATSGTFSIGGNYTNNGTFSSNNGTVTINGSSQQTLAGTMTTTNAFKTLTITNSSGADPDASPSVIFSAAATATTFNAVTASTKIRFLAGATYTFTTFNVNGQATGTRVQLRSSSSPTAWLLVASGSPVVYNTNPKDSNASGGSSIDASAASNLDGAGNTNWNFGGLSTDIVDSNGDPVGSPAVAMDNASLGFACQSATGTLGAASQKMRVSNSTGNPSWTLTIAPTDGATTTWTAGAPLYDFNDATASGCSDGIDADGVGGQLTMNASAGTVTPQGGCSSTGITKGNSAAFVQGTTDSVTILSASGLAETSCYWDLTGVSLSQSIPQEQTIGNYSLNMTITLTAN
ncbi:hypothetical protein HYV44_02415 [Candidatus Microgenomates bacterium]|nr:hypothetical protein [Candidatus Microgenomates bacterium]